MSKKKYFEVLLSGPLSALQFEKLQRMQVEHHSLGLKEYAYEEKFVDELLKEDAYCGGELPASIVDLVENYSLHSSRQISVYFEDESDAQNFINEVIKLTSSLSIALEEKEEEDWVDSWKVNFKRVVVSSFLSVVPEWEEHGSPQYEVYIRPGMGFGTGGHETTFLCLKLFEVLQNKLSKIDHVLDLGCGSGILGIAAIKRASSAVTFCDVDKDALDNCVYNLHLNFEGRRLDGTTVVARERYEVATYDLVFANILLSILTAEKMVITESVKKSGYLILSGVLNTQKDELLELYKKQGFHLIQEEKKGDWAALLMQRS